MWSDIVEIKTRAALYKRSWVTMSEKYRHSGYIQNALERTLIDEAIEKCLTALKNKRFDTIAFRGMSGALIAPIVAKEMKKEIILVRKEAKHIINQAHSARLIEGHSGAQRYVIIDDFISSGDTLREIIKQIKVFAPTAKVVGTVLYAAWKPYVTTKALKEKLEEGR